jgi:drug/metabolite transporter (DMT)-like permease
LARLFAIAGALCISFAAILVRLAEVSPATAALFRCLYALPLLIALQALSGRADGRPVRMRVRAFVAGVLFAVDLLLWHQSIHLIGAGLATVLANTQVVFVGLVAWWLWKERPSGAQMLAAPTVLLGVALLSGLGRADAYGSDPVGGVAYGVAAALAYTAFLLTFRAASTAGARTVGPLLDATLGTAVGVLLAGLLPGVALDLVPTWPAHGWLLLLGALVQVGGWLFIGTALPRLPAIETSLILLLQPMAAVLWGHVIFSERMSALQWAGVALTLATIGGLSIQNALAARERRPV